jgi:hypothetical protein
MNISEKNIDSIKMGPECYYAIPKIKLVIMDNRNIAESGVKSKKKSTNPH